MINLDIKVFQGSCLKSESRTLPRIWLILDRLLSQKRFTCPFLALISAMFIIFSSPESKWKCPKQRNQKSATANKLWLSFSCLSSSGQMSQVLELIEQLSLLTRKNLLRSQLQIRDAVKVYSRFTPISNSRSQFERQFNYNFKLESWFEKWRLWKFS